MAVQPRAGARRLGLGQHLALAGAVVVAAACGPTVPSPSRSVNDTEPTASSPAPAGSAEPSASALVEPPPPASFDPAGLHVLSTVGAGGLVGVWSSPVGRPDRAVALVAPEPEAVAGYGDVHRIDDETAVVVRTDAAGRAALRIVRAGQPPVEILTRVVEGSTAVAPAAGIAVAARETLAQDDGVWAVRLDGTEQVRVLPAESDGALLDRSATAIAFDGGPFASSRCPLPAHVAIGRATLAVAPGLPIGFDRAHRLIALADCASGTPSRLATDGSRASEPLAPEGIGYRAIVTPDGRFLAAVSGETIPGIVLIRDLESGAETRLPLAPGGWDPTTDTTERYVVLRRDDGQGERFAVTYAIVDLVEGWVGYVPVDTLPPG